MENENHNLEEIKKFLFALTEKIEKQNERIIKIEESLFGMAHRADNVIPEKHAAETLPPPPPPAAKERVENMEERIGGKWFAKIGVAVLVIGVSLFLEYAFDNDWIGETGRVILGILAGMSLLALGEKFIRKYFVYGQIITGGGLALLYLSIFAAFDFYHLIPSYAAFLIMVIITGVGIALSLRYDALSLIAVAIVGGFATPALCSTGVNNQIGLFSYILILDLAILIVSIFKKWRQLNVLGFIGTVLMFAIWHGKFYTSDQIFSTMFFLTLFFLIYSVSSLIYNLYKEELSTGTEQVLTLVTGFSYFATSYALLNSRYHTWMGFFALIMGIYYFLGAYLVRAITVKDENLYNFLAFLTVGFIALAIPIQFKQYVITIGWMIEALLLFYLGTRIYEKSGASEDNRNAMVLFGSVLAIIAVIRLLFFDASHFIHGEVLIFNKRFFTFLFAILCFYLASFLFQKASGYLTKEHSGNLKKLMAASLIVANLLTLFTFSQEIIHYHRREIDGLRTEQNNVFSEWRYQNDNYGAYQDPDYIGINKKITNLKYRQSISLSIFWLIYAIILLVIGFVGAYKGVRIGGMLLLTLAILKLFFYDLWSLGTLYRIISSISLGVVLLAISFAYQKYKDKLKEII